MSRSARLSSASRPARTACITVVLLLVATGLAQPWRLAAQAPKPAKGVRYAQISPVDMKEWLTYLASDELEGRQTFTEGYGLAAAYVADRLKEWKVKPLGADGTYFQPVKLNGYKSTRNSAITITTGGESKTFKHGDHVTFPANAGGKQTVAFTGVEFVGYGTAADYQGRDVKGKLVIWLPRPAATGGRGAPSTGSGPTTSATGTTPTTTATAAPGTPAAVGTTAAQPAAAGRGGSGTAAALSTLGAKAAMTFAAAPTPPTSAEEALTKAQQALEQAQQAVAQARQQLQGRGAARGAAAPGARGRGAVASPDFSTVVRVDNPLSPQVTADEAFFDALFAGAPVKFADLRAKAEKGEPLAPLTLAGVSGNISIDNAYELVNEQLSKNVVGMVEGTDPQLKDTYVLFGAHLDHVGYRGTGGARPEAGNCRRTSEPAAGRGQGRGAAGGRGAPALPPLAQQDIIFNGADDDGSGSTALLAIAKAFATGPKPKRSAVFVWHSGEESGLYGSRYNADFPVVPLEKVQAQLNMDMVGRDDCDNANGDYSNTVFVVGADRISTDLHNLIVETNASDKQPLKLDYELNDPIDPESVYTRSDHYSYAAKGIPIAFFTTGLHKDYHQVSDEVDKILFPKMARIAQLVYESGFSIANTDRVLQRDNKGPRSGKGFAGKIAK